MSAFNFTRQEAETILSALRTKITQQIAFIGIADGYTVAVAEDLERLLAQEAAEAVVVEAPVVEAPVEEAPAE